MKNEKFVYLFVVLFIFLTFFRTSVFAQSNYVLPYPSSMPGNLSYKTHLLYEIVSRYWYFGDFGQFDYNLKLSDKYLVEAKTLFEYKQYLLGYQALKKSDKYFINILPNLVKAEKNDKNVSQKKAIFTEAAQKHIEILRRMLIDNPETFNWQPERALSTNLDIKSAIGISIKIRNNNL